MNPYNLKPKHLGQTVRILGTEGGLSDYEHHYQAKPGQPRQWTHATVYHRGRTHRLTAHDHIHLTEEAT